MDKHIGAQYYTIRDSIQNVDDFAESCKKISEIILKSYCRTFFLNGSCI